MVEQLAVLVYGVLTLISAIILASMQHSLLGMVLAFSACGVTYLFQFAQLLVDNRKKLDVLVFLSVILTIASAAASTFGF